jgi:phytoene dehydrogenase-like protein
MAEKSIVIIGAGIAGLAAGCYGQMNGYRTEILEMHDKPGGLCTAWTRKGYTIDGCLHWLTDSKPGPGFYRVWEELGAIQGRQMVYFDAFGRLEGRHGEEFVFHSDLDRLERHMLELSPEDGGLIRDFIKDARKCLRFEMPIDKAPELYGPLDGLKMLFKMLPFLGTIRKWDGMSMQDFAARLKSPFLKEVFPLIWFPEFSMFPLIGFMAGFHQQRSGYPLGGSLEFSRAIEKRYLDLGGRIQYKSKVAKVIVENRRAVGIRLEDGTEYRGDCVISAADGYATIFEMLDGKYVDNRIRGYYEKLAIFPPLVYVAMGVNRVFSDVPRTISGFNMPLAEPVAIGGRLRERLDVHVYNHDPSLAPAGKTVVICMIGSDYGYWKKLREDPEQYRAAKEKTAHQVIMALDKRWPGFASQVEMWDVATPVTFHRYTGNWQGSFEGWMLTPGKLTLQMKKTLPGLDRFYMAGQWVAPPGGIPSAAFSARSVIQIICKRDKKQFDASVP